MAALAYPDRIGLRRKGDAPRWVLSGGKGAAMDAGTPLSGARLIVATDLDGDPREARIRQAMAIWTTRPARPLRPRIRWHDALRMVPPRGARAGAPAGTAGRAGAGRPHLARRPARGAGPRRAGRLRDATGQRPALDRPPPAACAPARLPARQARSFPDMTDDADGGPPTTGCCPI
jgi:hypothetical protein